jgi:glycine/D-amino acid oxidase-like deaminating enzyme
VRHTRLGWWIEEAGGLPPARSPLRERTDADVVVLGGGYTGLWAAWWIKRLQPEADVVLLEREVCGSGPSGRNGGFVNSMWFSLPTLQGRFGEQGGLAIARAAAGSVGEVGAWCEQEGVDAWYLPGGYLQASAAVAQDGVSAPAVEAMRRAGAADAFETLDAAAARSRCDSAVFRGATFYRDAATVQPARLAFGLRDALLARGVRIHEHTEARLRRRREGVVETAEGAVRAGRVVVAIGGRALAERSLRRALTMTSSHIVLTEPVPDVLDELGWDGGECITDSRAMIHYFRTTRDGRIAFGWGGGRIIRGARIGVRTEVDARMIAEVRRHLLRFFPQLEGRRLEHAWGGPIDVSPTHLPVIRSLPGGGFAGFGYTGNGVGPAQMVGRSLASLALGLEDEAARLPLIDPPAASVPPEPFRWAGGALIRSALLRKERLEEDGRRPGPITRAISGIPERMGIHVGR